jgi:hypothetical protein
MTGKRSQRIIRGVCTNALNKFSHACTIHMKQTLDSEIKGKRRMYNADFFSKHLHGLIKFTTHFGHEKLQEKWAMILK